MDNITNIEQKEINRELIKELFIKQTSPGICDKWGDAFEIEIVDEKHINVVYHGNENIKVFIRECRETLRICIYSVIGFGCDIKIIRKSGFRTLSPTVQKNIRAAKFLLIGMIFVCFSIAVVIVLSNYIGNRNFRETFYTTSSIKVDGRVRVIQISDLHGSLYGNENEKLLARVEALKPDIIICTGDIIDTMADDADYAVKLAEKLAEIAPAYYIYGNHETEEIYDFALTKKELDEKLGFVDENCDETALLGISDPFEERLESAGIKVLKNEMDTIQVGAITIDIYGVLTSNSSAFWSYTEKSFADYINEAQSNLKITAVHEPTIFEDFHPGFWGDLMIAGHTHGGFIRVPVLGPLYTHEGGLFPERSGKFVYGRYSVEGKHLIVSSGLENSSVFRVNNQPELVIIDINKF